MANGTSLLWYSCLIPGHPSHTSQHFRQWWSANVSKKPDGKKRTKGSKDAEVGRVRRVLIGEILDSWEVEEKAVVDSLSCTEGLPSVVKSAMVSAAGTSNKKHKEKLMVTAFAFQGGLLACDPDDGIEALNSLIEHKEHNGTQVPATRRPPTTPAPAANATVEPPNSRNIDVDTFSAPPEHDPMDAFTSNWSKALAAAAIPNGYAYWIDQSVSKSNFLVALRAITKYLVTRRNAKAVKGKINVEKNDTLSAIKVLGYQAQDYRVGKINADSFCLRCKGLAATLNNESARVNHLIVMQNQRHKKGTSCTEGG